MSLLRLDRARMWEHKSYTESDMAPEMKEIH